MGERERGGGDHSLLACCLGVETAKRMQIKKAKTKKANAISLSPVPNVRTFLKSLSWSFLFCDWVDAASDLRSPCSAFRLVRLPSFTDPWPAVVLLLPPLPFSYDVDGGTPTMEGIIPDECARAAAMAHEAFFFFFLFSSAVLDVFIFLSRRQGRSQGVWDAGLGTT